MRRVFLPTVLFGMALTCIFTGNQGWAVVFFIVGVLEA